MIKTQLPPMPLRLSTLGSFATYYPNGDLLSSFASRLEALVGLLEAREKPPEPKRHERPYGKPAKAELDGITFEHKLDLCVTGEIRVHFSASGLAGIGSPEDTIKITEPLRLDGYNAPHQHSNLNPTLAWLVDIAHTARIVAEAEKALTFCEQTQSFETESEQHRLHSRCVIQMMHEVSSARRRTDPFRRYGMSITGNSPYNLLTAQISTVLESHDGTYYPLLGPTRRLTYSAHLPRIGYMSVIKTGLLLGRSDPAHRCLALEISPSMYSCEFDNLPVYDGVRLLPEVDEPYIFEATATEPLLNSQARD